MIIRTAILGLGLALAVPVAAQEAKPTLRENTAAVEVRYYKFKDGTNKRREEVEKLFTAASKAAGTSVPTVVHLQSGPWDSIYIFTLEGGFADLNYAVDPSNAKWMNELAKANGGMAKAEALVAEWGGTVERSSSDLGHIHK